MFPVVSEREWAVKSKFDVRKQYTTVLKLEVYFWIAKNFRETEAFQS